MLQAKSNVLKSPARLEPLSEEWNQGNDRASVRVGGYFYTRCRLLLFRHCSMPFISSHHLITSTLRGSLSMTQSHTDCTICVKSTIFCPSQCKALCDTRVILTHTNAKRDYLYLRTLWWFYYCPILKSARALDTIQRCKIPCSTVGLIYYASISE